MSVTGASGVESIVVCWRAAAACACVAPPRRMVAALSGGTGGRTTQPATDPDGQRAAPLEHGDDTLELGAAPLGDRGPVELEGDVCVDREEIGRAAWREK